MLLDGQLFYPSFAFFGLCLCFNFAAITGLYEDFEWLTYRFLVSDTCFVCVSYSCLSALCNFLIGKLN
jgi:hypothetical protein